MLPKNSLNLSRDFAQMAQNMRELKGVSGMDKSIGGQATSMSHDSTGNSMMGHKREYYILNVDSATSPLVQTSKIDETLAYHSLRTTGEPQQPSLPNTPLIMEVKNEPPFLDAFKEFNARTNNTK